MKKWLQFIGIIVASVVVAVFPLQAGTTGKITGRVVDQSTGDPLPGANVFLENTTMGAATDLDGNFVILNVPPGVFTVRARMIGYTDMRVEGVVVRIDLTSTVNFSLQETVLDIGEAVTIIAERPMIIKDLTATTAVVGAEDMQALPVTEVSEAVELQAGLIKGADGGLHVRGGRSGELSYWIDGMPITDVYDGGAVVDVNKNMVQELQVVSGAFNAEYGQAMSGIVNIATKDGNNTFGGSISTYFGDYLSSNKDIFTHIDDFNPAAIHNFDLSLQGPVLKDKFFFYLNGRYINFDGYHYGQRLYNPWAVTTNVTGPSDLIEPVAPDYSDRMRDLGNGIIGFPYVLGTNAFIDSIIVAENLPQDLTFEEAMALYQAAHALDGRGDDAYVPMNWNQKLYGQAKLVYKFTPSLKVAYNIISDNVDYQDYDRNYMLNPDGNLLRFRRGLTQIGQLTHAIDGRTFYQVGVSYFTKSYRHYVSKEIANGRFVHPLLDVQDTYSFKTSGTNNSYFQRETATLLGKADITSQITRVHQVKAGIEFRNHNVFQEDITVRPDSSQVTIDPLFESPLIANPTVEGEFSTYYSTYRRKPTEFSLYLQDKMEFNNMIVNVGVRYDYFDADGVVLANPEDPEIYNPREIDNIFKDYGTDGQPNTYDPDGTENNNIRDAGEPLVTLQERQAYWYRKVKAKSKISPRIGVSFPITERGVIHFSYGHFFQIPRFERLYQNPDFEVAAGSNIAIIGNADLEPEQTVNGEIGLQQQLSEDISVGMTGFFRDIRNLAGSRAEVRILKDNTRYIRFVNSDFGFVKGLTLSLNKRFSGGFSASFDYTLQEAKGTNSDPEQARNALNGGALPEVQLTPLDWDQKHTVNASFSYAAKSYGLSLIGQWGSGLPYTPRNSQDVTSLLTNNQRKKAAYNIDLRAYKDLRIGTGTLTVFTRVFNLFDTLNEVNVYNDSGQADFTIDQPIAESQNPLQLINTLEQWFTNATHYSEPRRVELGVTYSF
ncbi:TonB-dependent receptor [candidate division KSB1 bacterium]|nr:TonB-dependent receptor [candidate division KSB1 bacterium]